MEETIEEKEIREFKEYWQSIETVNDLSVAIANIGAVPDFLRDKFSKLQAVWEEIEELMWSNETIS